MDRWSQKTNLQNLFLTLVIQPLQQSYSHYSLNFTSMDKSFDFLGPNLLISFQNSTNALL